MPEASDFYSVFVLSPLLSLEFPKNSSLESAFVALSAVIHCYIRALLVWCWGGKVFYNFIVKS